MSSLDQLAATHERAVAAGKTTTAASARRKARVLAAQLGVDAPAWSAAKPKQAAHAASPAHGDEIAATALEVPAALRAWREARPQGRVVNVRRDGSVRLLVFGTDGHHQEAAFGDLRTAERALLLGVTWRPLRKTDSANRVRPL